MRAALSVLAILLVAWPAHAQRKIAGDHDVRPGGFAVLRVEGAGKTVLWTVTPNPIQEEEIGGSLVFTGQPGGEYTATAIVIDFEAKTAEKLRHAVRFAGSTPPPGPVSGLVGTEVWGSADTLMVGDTKWAERVGYTRARLVKKG